MAAKKVWLRTVGPWLYDDATAYSDDPTIFHAGLRSSGNIIVSGTITSGEVNVKDTSAEEVTLGFEDAGGAGDLVFDGDTGELKWDGTSIKCDGECKVVFRDSAIYIFSDDDGHLDLTADVSIDLNAPDIYLDGDVQITGDLVVDGAMPVGDHTHTAAGDGGQLDWDNIWTDAVHTHQSAAEGGTIKLDDWATPDDNTDLDATSLRHGLLPKLSGDSGDVLRGDGTWGAVAIAAALVFGATFGLNPAIAESSVSTAIVTEVTIS